MFYHMSRRPITVVKTKFIDCPEDNETTTTVLELVRIEYLTADTVQKQHMNAFPTILK